MRQALLDPRAQPIQNVIRNGRGRTLTQWTTVGAGLTIDGDTIKVTADGVTTNRASAIAYTSAVGTGRDLPAGKYVLAFDAKIGPDAKFVSLRLLFYSSSTQTSSSYTFPTLPSRTKFDRMLVSVTPSVPFDRVYFEFRNAGTGAVDIVAGDVGGWLRTVMLVPDPGTLPAGFGTVYADGDTAGWRWFGTAGASGSVGYPWTV